MIEVSVISRYSQIYQEHRRKREKGKRRKGKGGLRKNLGERVREKEGKGERSEE